MLETHFKDIAEIVALAIQAGAVVVVSYGAAEAIIRLVRAVWRREPTAYQGRVIWLEFATWILLGLEFALAADLVKTAITPTWDDVGKLAVIAAVRTMLNYFLARDIAAFRAHMSEAEGGLGRQPARRAARRAGG